MFEIENEIIKIFNWDLTFKDFKNKQKLCATLPWITVGQNTTIFYLALRVYVAVNSTGNLENLFKQHDNKLTFLSYCDGFLPDLSVCFSHAVSPIAAAMNSSLSVRDPGGRWRLALCATNGDNFADFGCSFLVCCCCSALGVKLDSVSDILLCCWNCRSLLC